MKLKFIEKKYFDKLLNSGNSIDAILPLIAKMNRLNTLFAVKRAGSGHLGSSFSAMDIVNFLYFKHLNLKDVGFDSEDRDIYFSSKGHDVPGQYATLYSLGVVPEEKLLKLRRLGGLDGHPDVKIPGIEANTGSLGMGISKGRGMAYTKRMKGKKGRVIVMTGDGELQEGQNFEALQTTVQQKENNIIVVVDHNKLQSDRYIDRIVGLGNLEAKFAAFGWEVARCDGHDYKELERVFHRFDAIVNKPKVVICDTIKGKGVSFMEHPQALQDNNGFYRWHAGAPADEHYERAYTELFESISKDYQSFGLGKIDLKEVEAHAKSGVKVSDEYVAEAYGQALVDQAKTNKNFVVLDADLSLDCRLRTFEDTYPERFIECGIAEQDMVSMAAGIALQGYTPVVNSFANFLAARTNEQIFNALSEEKKIVFACHYAGLLPAGPGKSHQCIRDISLFSAYPNCVITQGCSAKETEMLVDYALNQNKVSTMIRLAIGPSPSIIPLPKDYKISVGKGVTLTDGDELVLMSYGPVMMNEALVAQSILEEKGQKLKVINMPWLNRCDEEWLKTELKDCRHLFVLEDHSSIGALRDSLVRHLTQNGSLLPFSIESYGVDCFPACGTPQEALQFHKLDGASVAERILSRIQGAKKAAA